jgi:hypothetical protein
VRRWPRWSFRFPRRSGLPPLVESSPSRGPRQRRVGRRRHTMNCYFLVHSCSPVCASPDASSRSSAGVSTLSAAPRYAAASFSSSGRSDSTRIVSLVRSQVAGVDFHRDTHYDPLSSNPCPLLPTQVGFAPKQCGFQLPEHCRTARESLNDHGYASSSGSSETPDASTSPGAFSQGPVGTLRT